MINEKLDTTKDIRLNWYQDRFMFSEARYNGIIAAVGSGKTFTGLLKAWNYCEMYPKSLGLIVRKEFIDLQNSTIKDFEMNFGVKVGRGKQYEFENGSVIMFTHGNMADINVLKNINLSFFVIEQAEEYETADIFDFLRDRLRRKGGPRWGGIIANAAGHNWIYERFIDGAKADVHKKETGEVLFTKGDRYLCTTATSFANAHNLPEDFVDDLKAMKVDAPQHYEQYVMNNFNVVDADDLVFTPEEIDLMRESKVEGNVSNKLLGADLARYGKDKCVVVAVEEVSGMKLREVAMDSWGKKDAIYSVGRIADFGRLNRVDAGSIDGDGLGGPMYDNLRELVGSSYKLKEFRGGMPSTDNKFANLRTQCYFMLKDLAAKGWVHIESPEILNDLASLRYMYNKKGQRMMVPKEVLRTKGLKSPDFADAFMMVMSIAKLKFENKKYRRRNKSYVLNTMVDY